MCQMEECVVNYRKLIICYFLWRGEGFYFYDNF